MQGRWFPNWGGVPFCLCPFGSPHPDRAAFVWSTHSCGLVVAWAGSSLPLPVFFLPQGCSLSLRPGLPPALSPTLCSGFGRLQLWFWGGAFSPPGFRSPEHSSHGALGMFPGGQELGALPCPAETSISSSHNLVCHGLGLVQLPFLSGIQSLLRLWHVVVRQPQVGHKLGRCQTHSPGTGHCV